MPLRILFISHKFYPDIGGIEVNSEILANAFCKAGHDVRLITWTEAIGEKQFSFPVIRNPGIRSLLREHRWAEVVFENNLCMRLAWPSIFFNRPSVIALRTWVSRIDGQIGWQDKLKQLWLQRASAVIAVSEAVRKRCWPAAIVIGNPYRYNLFRILPEVTRTADFVFLGRLVSDKGADLAIKAFHRFFTARKNKMVLSMKLSLTIIGDGPDRLSLEDLVLKLRLKDHVTFTGSLKGESLANCLNQHRYILVPSIWEEPFGNVALEGMACGCVPIVSNGGGLPDAIGKAGLTFTRGDIDSLEICMRKALENPAIEHQLRQVAVTHLAAHHPDVVGQRYLKVLETFKNN